MDINLKIISGTKKGVVLFTSDDLSVRPTADKVKQAIFNIIRFQICEGKALDLFCGSGAMGIESLSEGMNFCDFVDVDTKYAKKNIEKCNFDEKAAIFNLDFKTFLEKKENERYSLIFLDPPYHKDYLSQALKKISDNQMLLEDGIIVIESDATEKYIIPSDIEIIKEKKYGRVKINIGKRHKSIC